VWCTRAHCVGSPLVSSSIITASRYTTLHFVHRRNIRIIVDYVGRRLGRFSCARLGPGKEMAQVRHKGKAVLRQVSTPFLVQHVRSRSRIHVLIILSPSVALWIISPAVHQWSVLPLGVYASTEVGNGTLLQVYCYHFASKIAVRVFRLPAKESTPLGQLYLSHAHSLFAHSPFTHKHSLTHAHAHARAQAITEHKSEKR
jgi:hypothetical protein